MAIGFLFDYACGCDVFVSYDTILGKDIFIQVLRQSGMRRWHGPCDSRRCCSGKVSASAVFPCGGSKPFEVSFRCPTKAPRSLPRAGLGSGRAGTRRALRPHHASGTSRASAPFSPCEALRIFQSAGAQSAAGAGRPSALWRIRRPGRPPRRPHSGDAVPPCPEAVLPREHANSACPLSAPLPLCFAFTPLPRAASPCGALPLRSAPGIRKAQMEKGERGSGHPHCVRSDCAARRKRSASSRRRAPPGKAGRLAAKRSRALRPVRNGQKVRPRDSARPETLQLDDSAAEQRRPCRPALPENPGISQLCLAAAGQTRCLPHHAGICRGRVSRRHAACMACAQRRSASPRKPPATGPHGRRFGATMLAACGRRQGRDRRRKLSIGQDKKVYFVYN